MRFAYEHLRRPICTLVAIGVVTHCGALFGEPIRQIVVDGSFSDWAIVPSHGDPQNDQHDTDHDGRFDTPSIVNHPDVDLLEFKFAHDDQNLYAYFRARGQIGRTQHQSAGRPGRYYVIVTIDVDNSDTSGYWLHEGGYYPTSRGYDMNMELEFYNGAINTGHYLSHDALTQQQLTQDFLNLTSGQWTQGNDGPYTPGFVQPAPGNYDNYTQWSYQSNDTLTIVRDGGTAVPGIIEYALSPDGHELEMRAPYRGFLNDATDNPNVALGKTMDVSFSLEASGELFAAPGSNGTWASDTGIPITSYFLNSPGDYDSDGDVDAADYVVWRKTDGMPAGNNAWRSHFGEPTGSESNASVHGTVPEPSALLMIIATAVSFRLRRRHLAKRVF
jgi:hypothetical protein